VFAPPLPAPVFLKLVEAIDPLKVREKEPLKEAAAAVAAV
jgi:hypothetical protein